MQHPIVAYQAAAMPELYDCMPSEPKINVLYVAPEHEIITPEQVEASKLQKVGPGVTKISPSMVVKSGARASLIEAKTMLFIAERTSIPIPKLYAAYAYGPLDRDVGEFGTVYDVYIFMEFMEGETLERAWEKCSTAEKRQISMDLKTYITELRSIPSANYIGSVQWGPVTDPILKWSSSMKGPFDSEDDFNTVIADAFVAKSTRQDHVGPHICSMLKSHKHGIVFTHGDLNPSNIIIRGGRVEAIVDWQMSGWYPEYWEFAKAFYSELFTTDWATHLLEALTPYHCEQLMYQELMRVLW